MTVWAIFVQSVLKGVCSSFSYDICAAGLYVKDMFD